jgi:uncharacterized damage-inducible protein DinB
MDLLEHYVQLASYDNWANLEVASSLRAIGTPPPRSQKWMAHILAAEHVWLARLLQRQPRYPVWPDLSLGQCEDEARQLLSAWNDYLANGAAESLEGTITYKNSKGESWNSRVRDVLTHVFMHSAYHRGQIASDMRQAGHVPAYTDFIHGVRQGLVA